MTWQYQQSTGTLSQDGVVQGIGYSGCGEGRNAPGMQAVPNVGPIPQGQYTIGQAYNDPNLGPCVMHLDPTPDTNTFGRSLFRMHGNNINNDASHGCIIMPPSVRQLVSASNDTDLVVIS